MTFLRFLIQPIYYICFSFFPSIYFSFSVFFMPKLIDYPRTSYTGAWEVAEVVDDTGGKCALETCARKLNRKVSGSFKAIVGSGVKFGLLTSKRELLTTTTLFRRIKHAYDKQEELIFHREAFLTPPLFTQLCRKFRSRELPVAMLDVLLIREFSVEEINAQGVAKAFIDGARMVGLLDENNTVADIDQLAAQQPPRRELASPTLSGNVFRQSPTPSSISSPEPTADADVVATETPASPPIVQPEIAQPELLRGRNPLPTPRTAPAATTDAIAQLFGFGGPDNTVVDLKATTTKPSPPSNTTASAQPSPAPSLNSSATLPLLTAEPDNLVFRIQLTGPGINTQLDVVDVDDLLLVRALLDKIERRLKQ